MNTEYQTTRISQAVLVVDIVESTRLLEQNEEDTIIRWRKLVEHAERTVLPKHHGRLVKSTGDGILLAFHDCKSALAAAFEIQQISRRENASQRVERQILLRMSLEFCDVIVDQNDIYGRGVMRAVRLLTLAGPGEIVVSANVREKFIPTLDADVVDLGECYLKHVEHPIRAYRVGPIGPHPVVELGLGVGELYPSIAIIPFAGRNVSAGHQIIGEVLADRIINALSRSPELKVISRLSTTAFRDREIDIHKIGHYLNANYVLSGVYIIENGRLALDAELVETKLGRIVWNERIFESFSGLLANCDELIDRIVAEVCTAVMASELQRAGSHPLPTLESYTLLVSAISLMHRLSRDPFIESQRMLQTLIDRATRQSVPHAWLAYWYVLKVQQGWSDDPHKDGMLALECTKRALDSNPRSSLAHTINGFVHTNLLKQLDIGEQSYQCALENNPNEAMAWLLKGTLHAFRGEGDQAVEDTQRALGLTPMDPLHYFYDSLAATACLAAHQYENARVLAHRSMRANRVHTSTFRVLAASEWFLGMHKDARKTAQELMRLEPTLTVSDWLARSPSAEYEIGADWAAVLRQVGIPD